MKAKLTSHCPAGPEWGFEVKLDGIRAIAVKRGREVKLFSRRPREITSQFPEIAQALRAFPMTDAVLDGEIVALDEKGRSSFQLLQNARHAGPNRSPLRYYVFDLVHAEGRDLKALPLDKRKTVLGQALAGLPEPLRFSDTLDAKPEILWPEIQKLGLEGLIAKMRDSKYEPDRRSGAWLKIKARHEQEFVIGGYTAPQGARSYLGSVLVGYHEGGKLMFASKVGTGFDTKSLGSLFKVLQTLRTPECPFGNLPIRGRRGGFSAADMRRATWVRPKLVCQVAFMEWTTDGGLRHPVFLGLREDKKAKAVVREQAER